jgi:hypothetical protein
VDEVSDTTLLPIAASLFGQKKYCVSMAFKTVDKFLKSFAYLRGYTHFI